MKLIPNFINSELGFTITDEEFKKYERVFPIIEVIPSTHNVEYTCNGESIAYETISSGSIIYTPAFFNRFGSLITSLCELSIRDKIIEIAKKNEIPHPR